MQKITETIDGRYVSVHMEIEYRKICKEDVVILRIYEIKHNAIDQYYNELELCLAKLTQGK